MANLDRRFTEPLFTQDGPMVPRESISSFLVQSAESLLEAERNESSCRRFLLDVDFIRERILNPDWEDFDAVADYIQSIIKEGIGCGNCLWSDGDSCLEDSS